MKTESPLPLWQIIATILGGLVLMWFVAGLMFQSAIDQGL